MSDNKPRVYVVATGGSISCIGRFRTDFINYTYQAGHLTIQEMIARVPEVNEFADVRAEQFLNVDSNDVGPANWPALAKRVNRIFEEDTAAAGVAIPHGTATLDETAYFLNLTVRSRKPVVLTGSMRPPTGLSTDADVNLLDCIRVASDPAAGGKGVLVVMNSEIQAARDVVKANATRVHTMTSRGLGCLGYADSDHRVVFYRAPVCAHTADSEFDVQSIEKLPRVDVAMAYAGADGQVIDALVERGVEGIVSAGLGSGGAPNEFLRALDAAVKKGVAVVVATQAGEGRVTLKQRFIDGGYIVADNLAPRKARILLMLALTRTRDAKDIQRMMLTY